MLKTTPTVTGLRGMHDVLPAQSALWQTVEQIIRDVLTSYSYQEIRLPIVEKTELFKRSIGEVTDIVEKEMYTFDDRNGDSITLRPEGTAGCLRACLEHGLLNQAQRLWYYGPMFRYERPQKGRYRQFYQMGLETYGIATADADAEVIALSYRLWQRLGIADKVTLQINSLGTIAERAVYREQLIAYFKTHIEKLDADSLRRLESNPLRILDSKNPAMQAVLQDAPLLMNCLSDESREHFQTLTDYLAGLNIAFEINPRLVRGIDYYSKTVFEWITTELGSQGAVCAGGRYDGLIAQLGGKENYAVGFALGVERLLALVELAAYVKTPAPVEVYLIRVGEQAQQQGFVFAEQLRDALPKLKLQVNCGGGSFKSQFKKADKSGAAFALILGDDEVARGEVAVKNLRVEQEQQSLSYRDAIVFLQNTF